jgi:F0F1-type ATP synthase membrane subunit c/vacuolar-type H+-ATPase subunit K
MTLKSVKSAAATAGKGLLTGSAAIYAAINDGPIHTRISEIDAEIAKLQEEKTRLQSQLIVTD